MVLMWLTSQIQLPNKSEGPVEGFALSTCSINICSVTKMSWDREKFHFIVKSSNLGYNGQFQQNKTKQKENVS